MAITHTDPRPPRAAIAVAGPGHEIDRVAREADALGIGRVVVAETAYDPLVQLAHAAATAPRIELATGVAIAFARTPMTLAYAAWSLQEASGGRAVVGLGSQIQPHIERRFGMPWGRPAARMRDFILATRAIFAAWQEGGRLAHRGEFYEHRLMTPMFAPAPLTGGPPPLLLAGVGPRMCAVAGEVADGLVAHPFGTPEFLREQVLPGVRAARATSEAAGEAWTQRPFEVDAGVLIATGETPAEIAAATTALRERIAFYASTPAYVGVLARHGHTAIQPELHPLSMRGKWAEMGRLIDDDLLHAVGVVGDSRTVAAEVVRRYGAIADRVTLFDSAPVVSSAALRAVAEIGGGGAA